jgi:hypothetical protein
MNWVGSLRKSKVRVIQENKIPTRQQDTQTVWLHYYKHTLMNHIAEFPQSVIEKLGYYVYLLIDPKSKKVFYVGKGTGNRIFAHISSAITSPLESDKLEKIREIQSNGLEINYAIIRHGLTEQEAFEVEAALIDFIDIRELTNIVAGHGSDSHGLMSITDIIAKYLAPEIEIVEPVVLITVNRLYRRNMNDDELYEITRGNWVTSTRRTNAKYAFCVYNGIVRQVYQIQRWFPVKARSQDAKSQNRWRFDGIVANELQHYVGGNVEKYVGSQNPIRYVNC